MGLDLIGRRFGHWLTALCGVVAAASAVGAVGALSAAACSRAAPGASTHAEAAARSVRDDASIRDLDIAFYDGRSRRDPTGAMDLARLAGLYLQRSRETGDPADAVRAERAARRSLRNRPARNDQAAQVLSSSLLAQHRFAEALDVARRVRDANPESAALRASVGEIQMELGDYDSARVAFDGVRDSSADLAVAPRLARWAEIEGRPTEARWLMRRALAAAVREPSLPREQLAWFWLRNGDLDMRAGRFAVADSFYRAGLAAHPGDYRLLAALAHVAAVEGNWRAAIAYGESAIAASLDPATLGVLSDAYAAIGDTARAREYERVLDVAVLRQPGAYHRAWSLFLLDHDRHVATVYRKIRQELRTRRDVYGYDLLAWALHKQGRDAEAAVAMRKALSQGTRDPLLARHAAEIARARGGALQ